MKEQSDSATALAEKVVTTPKEGATQAPIAHGGGKLGEVVVHVRFHPTGLVNTVNHRPDHISPQEWFDRLCRAAPLSYQPLSGGRGVFRMRSDAFDLIWRENEG